jgi:hypothetical protein
MTNGADGSIVAAPIWNGYMRRALEKTPVESFTPPAPPTTTNPALLGQAIQQTVRINKTNGLRATVFTPPDLVEERTYSIAHDILYFVDRDDPLGPPPIDPSSDPQYANWEAGMQAWITKNNWPVTGEAPTQDDMSVSNSTPPSDPSLSTTTIILPTP